MMEGYGDNSGLADEEGIITAFPKNKAEDLLEVIRNGMERDREVSYSHRERSQQPQQSSISVADELMKLANLKEKGIISDEEFHEMKQDLIKKKI
jgi:Short C-terminal domain